MGASSAAGVPTSVRTTIDGARRLAKTRRGIERSPGLPMFPTTGLRNGESIRTGRDVHVGESDPLWPGHSPGMIVPGEDVSIAPSVFTTVSGYGVVAGTPVVHQEKNERDVVVGDGVWLGTVVARVTGGAGAEVPAVTSVPPETTALPHGP